MRTGGRGRDRENRSRKNRGSYRRGRKSAEGERKADMSGVSNIPDERNIGIILFPCLRRDCAG